ncbi:MAG: hypothetical protein OEW00_02535 [candidate division Zixibacteria bacterium]|nr:hypothetical protein [candidate division Zixibacteria bacterium]
MNTKAASPTSVLVGALALMLLLASAGIVHGKSHTCSSLSFDDHLYHFEGVDIDFDGGSLFIIHEGRDVTTIEITADYQLLIDDELVKTDADQQKLLKEFYTLTEEITEQAKDIGLEGARIGIRGAKLGVVAVGRVLKLLSAGYDTDDLERDMERDAQKLEKEAAKLERRAAKIESLADDLEDVSDELKHEIPELRALRWF